MPSRTLRFAPRLAQRNGVRDMALHRHLGGRVGPDGYQDRAVVQEASWIRDDLEGMRAFDGRFRGLVWIEHVDRGVEVPVLVDDRQPVQGEQRSRGKR